MAKEIKREKDPKREEKLAAFDRLLTVMDELRLNCPWDMKQSWGSLRHLTIEEVYELSDALIDNGVDEVKGELGDLFLHLVFYSRIAQEKNQFHVGDVLNQVCDKLISRHPHIYADVEANDEAAVKANWEQIKQKEKGNKGVLGGVPRTLPALVKAMRIQEKARGAGFDWDEPEQVWEKVEEELEEFKSEQDADKKKDEFGDLLFSLINYARFQGINPEEALERTNKKFIRRFNYLESESKKEGKELKDMSLAEMDEYWNAAKKIES
ncbi:MAG: nucleoside triphosphate pyrophosphohydrolase [Cyclobacteriaceae bacterium]|nr:nucleoside triphosphate pyrophosphohydrolase [Cyclobacteriaceae bacterium]MCH8515595.1 nucleoside triphosphate pyrophosphohydrolase [Cyclobacteriaceae bacterium]